MCTVLLPPGDNPTTVNKYINTISEAFALLGRYAAYVGSCVPTFRNNLSVHIQRSSNRLTYAA